MTDKCYHCKRCGKPWGGEYGRNNAKECCKLTATSEVEKKRDYWKNLWCEDCGKFCKQKLREIRKDE